VLKKAGLGKCPEFGKGNNRPFEREGRSRGKEEKNRILRKCEEGKKRGKILGGGTAQLFKGACASCSGRRDYHKIQHSTTQRQKKV